MEQLLGIGLLGDYNVIMTLKDYSSVIQSDMNDFGMKSINYISFMVADGADADWTNGNLWKEVKRFTNPTPASMNNVSFSFDVSKYVTPVAGKFVSFKMLYNYVRASDGATDNWLHSPFKINNWYNLGLIPPNTLSNGGWWKCTTFVFLKAPSKPTDLTLTSKTGRLSDDISITFNASTTNGTYTPTKYRLSIIALDENDNEVYNKVLTEKITTTSFSYNIRNLSNNGKALKDYPSLKVKAVIRALDTYEWAYLDEVHSDYISLTNNTHNVLIKKTNGSWDAIGVNNIKVINGSIPQGMKTKILDDGSEWARIFWHDVSSTATYFTNESEVLSCNLSNRFSNLTNINNYRYNGAFELMLCYPKYSTSKYNRWIQRANPITTWETTKQTKSTMGYESIHIDFKTNWLYGMAQSSDGSASNTRFDCMAGHTNWFGAIGQYKPYNGGFPAPTESGMSNMQKEVELWVRINRSAPFKKSISGWTMNIRNDDDFKSLMMYANMNIRTDTMVVNLYNNITYTGVFKFIDFQGHFYGNGFTLTLTAIDNIFQKNSGIIEDLVVSGGQRIEKDYNVTGGICRENSGKIINCINNRSFSRYSTLSSLTVGGICGLNDGEVIKCLNRANIDNSSTTDASMITGGIVGKNSGLIQGCRSGTIDSQNEPYGTLKGYNVGGIVGYSLAGSKVQDCMSWNNLSGYYVGGIVGYSYKGEINHCINMSGINTETQSTTGTYYGGLCGYNNYGTYSNNFYDSIWARASVEYSTSTQTNSKTVPNHLYRSSGIADMLGLPYIYVNTYNGGLPSFSWERATRIEPDSLWGITDNIWLDNYQVGEPTNIEIHFERSFGHNGKHKKLDILIETLYRTRWSSRYYI